MRIIYLLMLVLLVVLKPFSGKAQNSYCTPSYTGYGYQNTGSASPFFTHIKNVTFGNLVQNTNAPLYQLAPTYQDYTNDTAFVAKTGTYPLSIFLGNGANPQICVVWIDWNQNYIFETTERVMVQFDPANQGSHIIKTTVTIPANAKTGPTGMRVVTRLSANAQAPVPDPCKNNDANTSTFYWSQNYQDYTVNVMPASTQTFQNVTALRNNFDEIVQGSTDNVILGIEVTTNYDGVLSPLTAGDFKFSTLGTTNPGDLTEAKLYYTGLSPAFTTQTQVGGNISNPGNSFTINAGQKLQPGKNYFWLVYDVSASALLGNEINARLFDVQISGIKRFPQVSNPGGFRRIGYCVSKGSQMNFIGVWNVQMGSIKNNTFYQQFSPYTYYSYLRDTLTRNTVDTITVQVGNGVNSAKLKVWIDWNRDGDFNDQGELIFDTVNFTAQQTNPIYPFLKRGFIVPSNAKVGLTRMRISTQQRPVTVFDACTNPVDIGEVEDYNVEVMEDGQPAAEFKSTIACLGDPTDFYDNSYTSGNYNISTWHWDFGDPSTNSDTSDLQNPSYTYTSAGVYNVTLTVNSNMPGTPSQITRTVMVEKPVADFSYTTPVYQKTVLFNDLTSGGDVMIYKWYFGDPQSGKNDSAMGPSPSHIFDTAGNYTITLIVMTSGGCIDTVVKNITVLQQQIPDADFTASSFDPYVSQSVNLIDQSVYSPTKWKWTISPSKYTYLNSSTDSSQNPQVSFDSLTTYTVFLEATNAAGSSTTSKTITTKNYTSPVAKIGATNTFVRVNEQVAFIDSSDYDPTAWVWNFGDTAAGAGNSSSLQYPNHAYSKAGYYTVHLKVTNPAGSDSVTRTNYILVSNGYNMCDNTATSSNVLQGFIYDSGGPSANYNDGSDCGFLINPNCAGKIFLSFSSFNMSSGDYLQVYDGVDSLGKPLFTGKGFTGNNNPGILIANSGAMYIREMTDGANNTSGYSASWSASLNQVPRAKIGNDSIAFVNSPLTFKNTTSVGFQNRYYWDFDDDGVDDDSTASPKYIYTTNGMRRIRLIAVNCAGSDTTYKYINIKNPVTVPVASFISDRDTVAVADYIKLTDLSTNGPSSWKWDISPAGSAIYVNGTDDMSQNPELVFALPGNYNVCLTASNMLGNSPQLCKNNYIIVKDRQTMCYGNFSSTVAAGLFYDSGDQGANYGDNENCTFLIQPCADNTTLKFKSFDLSSGDYMRVYDGIDNTGIPLFTGNGFTGNANPGPLTSTSGSLYIEFASDGFGTSTGWEAEWTSGVLSPAKADFDVPPAVYVNTVTWFKNKSTGKSPAYEWDFDNNGSVDSTTKEGYHIYTSTGNYAVSLTASNCNSSDTKLKQITVSAVSQTPVAGFMADYTMGDTGSIITLMDTSLNGVSSWNWTISPSTGWSWVEELGYKQRVKFTDTGYYTVCLTATNSQGNNQTCKNAYINIRQYCKPSPSYVSGVGITKVELHNFQINNAIDNLYSDYTGKGSVVTLEQKSTYTLTLSKNVSGVNQNWRAWVDWNNNGVFEGTEVILNQPTTSNTSVSANFTVGRNAILGIHRMRLSASYNNNGNQPCSVTFGEVEDYLIYIDIDRTPPVITITGSNPDSVEQGYTYTDKGATAWDNADGNISAFITTTQNINNMVTGTYEVKYNVSDSAGNKAIEMVRTVLVLDDMTGPDIVLNGKSKEVVQVYTTYVEKGITATDLVDGNVSGSMVVSGTVNTNLLGSYILTYTASDTKGNSSFITRRVDVVDTIPPVIALVGGDTVYKNCGDTYTDPGFTVTDNYDTLKTSDVSVTGVVNTNLNGIYTITYSVKDKSNNPTTKNRFVKVSGCPTGIGQVLNNSNITVYPNPTEGVIYILPGLPDEWFKNLNCDIYDETGRKVNRINVIRGMNEVNLAQYPAGIYLFRFTYNEESYQIRVIKQ